MALLCALGIAIVLQLPDYLRWWVVAGYLPLSLWVVGVGRVRPRSGGQLLRLHAPALAATTPGPVRVALARGDFEPMQLTRRTLVAPFAIVLCARLGEQPPQAWLLWRADYQAPVWRQLQVFLRRHRG